MSYEEFDWMEMLNSGTLAKQRVCVLDKYIDKHNLLALKGKNKPQKVNAIMDHLQSFAESTQTNKQSSLSVEEVDDHDEREVDEGDEALPIAFVLVMKTLYWEKWESRVISCQNQSRTLLNAVI